MLNKLGNLTFPGGSIEEKDYENISDITESLDKNISYEKELLITYTKNIRLSVIAGLLREMDEEITLDDKVFNVKKILKGSQMYLVSEYSINGAVCFLVNKSLPEEIAIFLKKRVSERTQSDNGDLPDYLSEIKEILIFHLDEVLSVNETGRITPNMFISAHNDTQMNKVTNRANKLLRKLIAVDEDLRNRIFNIYNVNIEKK